MLLTVPKAERLIQAPAGSASGSSTLPGSEMAVFSPCLHKEEARELSEASFMRMLIPLTSHSTLLTSSLPEGPTCRYRHTEDEISACAFGGDPNIPPQHFTALT